MRSAEPGGTRFANKFANRGQKTEVRGQRSDSVICPKWDKSKRFCPAFPQKAGGFQGRSPWSLVATSEISAKRTARAVLFAFIVHKSSAKPSDSPEGCGEPRRGAPHSEGVWGNPRRGFPQQKTGDEVARSRAKRGSHAPSPFRERGLGVRVNPSLWGGVVEGEARKGAAEAGFVDNRTSQSKTHDCSCSWTKSRVCGGRPFYKKGSPLGFTEQSEAKQQHSRKNRFVSHNKGNKRIHDNMSSTPCPPLP